MNIKNAILYTVLFLFFILPAQAETQFTVYGQVLDVDHTTPLNGVTVYLSAGGNTVSAVTTNGINETGTSIPGYFYFPTLPGDVSAGTPMTLTASYDGKSASITVPRAVNDTPPQRIDLFLSTGAAAPTPTATVSAITSSGAEAVEEQPQANLMKTS